ncbi:hypothetical protein M422DRAFT_28233, partial [Sphaerobolus stellatus SS14]
TDRRGTRGTREEGEEVPEGEKKQRLPKRNCAVLIGFCGTGCYGMQIQPNVRTIEGVLFGAMVKAGAISEDNADDPVKVGLARAARTDAGVHAAGNVISIKLIQEVPGVPDLVGKINEYLPPEIRLWSFLRAQNSFNAHTACDSRMYTYFLPTYVLIPPKPGSGLSRALKAVAEECKFPFNEKVHPFWEGVDPSSTALDDLQRKRKWRVDADTLARIRNVVTAYLGTHNFHNFTIGREFGDRSNHRHMKRIEVQDPVVYGDTEWVAILFHGQSFMLHQRKMVCALTLLTRTNTPPTLLEEMFGPSKVSIPKAPALGLLLEQPIFESYNKKIEESNAKLADTNDAAYRPLIDFEVHREAMNKFKDEQIYSRMRSQEDKNATFDSWIRSIDSYAGKDFWYLNSKGIIPPDAVLKKGARRPNPFRERKRFDTADSGSAEQVADESDEEIIDKAKLKDMEG